MQTTVHHRIRPHHAGRDDFHVVPLASEFVVDDVRSRFFSSKEGTPHVVRYKVGRASVSQCVPLALLLTFLPWSFSSRAEDNQLLSSWLGAQTNIHSWSADFAQIRTFKSLAQPLTATGHVWFAEPNRFHWELGNPPQTIAVRATNEMLVIYPRLKRVERYPLTGDQAGEWRDALALLESGFPRSEAEIRSRFKILSQTLTNQACELTLQPKSAAARKMMPQIKIAFGTNDFSLRSTELQFADGSSMRNDFANPMLNPPITPELFAPIIGGDFKVVEPLKK